MTKRENKIGRFFPFYPTNWVLSTPLQRCSLGARGLLIELMARSWLTGDEHGVIRISIDDLAFATHTSYEEVNRLLAELEEHSRITVNDHDERNRKITVPMLRTVGMEQEDAYGKKARAGKASGEARVKKRDDEKAFVRFWDAYPKKRDKQRCKSYWATHNLTAKVDVILEGLERTKAHWASSSTEDQFIPYPSTWLHGGRWDDVFEVEKPTMTPTMTKEEREARLADFQARRAASRG